MKLKKTVFLRKYKFFVSEASSFKKHLKNILLEERKNPLIQKSNKLFSFSFKVGLKPFTSRRFPNKDKKLLGNWEISNILEKNKHGLNKVCSSKKENIEYINVLTLNKTTPIFFNLKKDLCLLKWNYTKQFFFLLKELSQSLTKSIALFLRDKFSFFNGSTSIGFTLEKKTNNFFQHLISQIFFKSKKGFVFGLTKSSVNSIFFKAQHRYIILTVFLVILRSMSNAKEDFSIKKQFLFFVEGLKKAAIVWEGVGFSFVGVPETYILSRAYKTSVKEKKVISQLYRKNTVILKQNLFLSNSFKLSNVLGLKNFLWKRNNYYFAKGTVDAVLKIAQLLNKKLKYTSRRSSIQMLYLLARIEEKLEEVSLFEDGKAKETAKTNLLLLQGILNGFLKQKKERAIGTNMLIAPEETVFTARRKAWKLNLVKSILLFLEKQEYLVCSKYQNFIRGLQKKLTKQPLVKQKRLQLAYTKKAKLTKEQKVILFALNLRKRRALILAKIKRRKWKQAKLRRLRKLPLQLKAQIFLRILKLKIRKEQTRLWRLKKLKKFGPRVKFFKRGKSKLRQNRFIAKPWRKRYFSMRRSWAGFKPVVAGKFTTITQKKQLLSTWAGRNIDLFFVNALALSKFAYKLERIEKPHRKPNRLLSIIDRDFINKYKYIAIYIKDLVRIGFIAMFLKKPSFLAKFAAFQLAKLPKNRKETVFIRFLIRAIRLFSAGREEIVALRVKIKGRVNRWRRTKHIVGMRGTFPLQTITERIEQGTAQAINRKGAVGIRIWVRYQTISFLILQSHILRYMRYSRLVKVQRRRKAIFF